MPNQKGQLSGFEHFRSSNMETCLCLRGEDGEHMLTPHIDFKQLKGAPGRSLLVPSMKDPERARLRSCTARDGSSIYFHVEYAHPSMQLKDGRGRAVSVRVILGERPSEQEEIIKVCRGEIPRDGVRKSQDLKTRWRMSPNMLLNNPSLGLMFYL